MHRVRRSAVGAVVVLAWCVGAPAHADVKLPAVIGSHMVLQQGMPVPVWGWADPGEQVTVTLGDQKQSATADPKGTWRVKLNALTAGGPHVLTVAGKNTVTLEDVLVGEVWVCSGQSNMNMRLGGCRDAKQEIAAATYPQIRLFLVPTQVAQEPQTDVKGAWRACSPKTAGGFSGVGYFFGRELHKALGVPVGLIHSAVGGTVAEAWTSRHALEAQPVLKSSLAVWDKAVANWPNVEPGYNQKRAEWRKVYRAWRQAQKQPGAKKTRRPRGPGMPMGPKHTHLPGGLYNGMIAPLMPLAIRGAIWYQGEANAGRAEQYRTVFPAMIRDWRKNWGQGEFPFLFVQLTGYAPGERHWPYLREAQTMALSLPKTGMAVTIDVGAARDIHPKNKQDVGKRLALAGLAIGYDKDVVYSGPMYKSMKVEGNKIRLTFDHVGGGLVPSREAPKDCPVRGTPACCGGKKCIVLMGFTIAGKDKKFVEAEAAIDGQTVVVSSPQVAEPVAVRYAWGGIPACNLYNKAGLPASPFRTDSWPRAAAPRRRK